MAAMATTTTNILLSSFPGLNLPKTQVIPVPSSSTVGQVYEHVSDRLPFDLCSRRLYLTTSDNKHLHADSRSPLVSLLPAAPSHGAPQMLSLRLSAPLCGGKGGFGSQLRAAGGKMSSRKKRNQGDNNGSSRNLDGRRLRTVNEAKALAEYLAVKPEMEKREKDERRKRWEAVVEAADRKEQEIREGGEGKGKARVDGRWAEDKEEQESKMREAIERAMADGMLVGGGGERGSSDESMDGSDAEGASESASEDNGHGHEERRPTAASRSLPSSRSRRLHGWDDDDDDEDDSGEENAS